MASTMAAPTNLRPLPSGTLVNCHRPSLLLPLLVGCCIVVHHLLSSSPVAHCGAIVNTLVAGRFHHQSSTSALRWFHHQPLPFFTSSNNGWLLRCCPPPTIIVDRHCDMIDSFVATLPQGALVASRRPPLPFSSMVGCCIIVCRLLSSLPAVVQMSTPSSPRCPQAFLLLDANPFCQSH